MKDDLNLTIPDNLYNDYFDFNKIPYRMIYALHFTQLSLLNKIFRTKEEWVRDLCKIMINTYGENRVEALFEHFDKYASELKMSEILKQKLLNLLELVRDVIMIFPNEDQSFPSVEDIKKYFSLERYNI